MADLLKFIFNKKILSEIVELGYNQVFSHTLSFYKKKMSDLVKSNPLLVLVHHAHAYVCFTTRKGLNSLHSSLESQPKFTY